jgi:hypothetical protein
VTERQKCPWNSYKSGQKEEIEEAGKFDESKITGLV